MWVKPFIVRKNDNKRHRHKIFIKPTLLLLLDAQCWISTRRCREKGSSCKPELIIKKMFIFSLRKSSLRAEKTQISVLKQDGLVLSQTDLHRYYLNSGLLLFKVWFFMTLLNYVHFINLISYTKGFFAVLFRSLKSTNAIN